MIGALLRIPFDETVRRIHEGLAERGYADLRPSHFVVFQHLDSGGNHVTLLADRAQMTTPSMSYLVEHLERHGYLERVPDPRDGRARIVRSTAKGNALTASAREILAGLEAEWEQAIGTEAMAQLRRHLQSLATHIETE